MSEVLVLSARCDFEHMQTATRTCREASPARVRASVEAKTLACICRLWYLESYCKLALEVGTFFLSNFFFLSLSHKDIEFILCEDAVVNLFSLFVRSAIFCRKNEERTAHYVKKKQ